MTALGVHDQPLQPQYWWIQEEMKQWWHFKGEFVNGRYEHDWLSVAAHKINTNNPNLNTLIRGGGWLYQRLGRERPEATCGGPAIDLLWEALSQPQLEAFFFFFFQSFLSSEIIFQGNVYWNKEKTKNKKHLWNQHPWSCHVVIAGNKDAMCISPRFTSCLSF